MVGPVGVIVAPQMSVTTGGVGVRARAAQATVEPSPAGTVKSSTSMV